MKKNSKTSASLCYFCLNNTLLLLVFKEISQPPHTQTEKLTDDKQTERTSANPDRHTDSRQEYEDQYLSSPSPMYQLSEDCLSIGGVDTEHILFGGGRECRQDVVELIHGGGAGEKWPSLMRDRQTNTSKIVGDSYSRTVG